MNKAIIKLLLIPLILLGMPSLTKAQAITPALEGHRPAFRISTDSMEMTVVDQLLIKRAVRDYFFDRILDAAYGMAYESWHLEFITRQPILLRNLKGKKESFIRIELYNRREECIGRFDLVPDRLQSTKSVSGQKTMTYSVNLIDIPLILLDRTKRVDIQQIEQFR
ncbi:MAG: hypothetical protein AAF242_20955 [Bacteroidota bacterium]